MGMSANNVSITKVEKLLRKPWHAGWRLVSRVFYQGREYPIQVPQGQRLFTPWYRLSAGDPFTSVYTAARATGYMGVSSDRCYLLYQLVKQSLHIPGDLVECGVYKGGTAYMIASVMAAANQSRTLHLFDSFEGMPASAVPGRDHHKPGDFSNTSFETVQARLRSFAEVCRFHCGFMPDTFSELPGSAKFAFAHIDVDIYPSVMDCCRFLWPRMSPGGCMVFDDYGFYAYRYAARKALDDFFAVEQERPIVLPTGQAVVIKLP